jgi:hypothetical protein
VNALVPRAFGPPERCTVDGGARLDVAAHAAIATRETVGKTPLVA